MPGDVIPLGDPRLPQLMVPLAGTIRWSVPTEPGEEPVALGIWGKDFPCTPCIAGEDGEPRELSRQELRHIRRMAAKQGMRYDF